MHIIKFTPYCGQDCKVIEVHKADIILHPKHIEVLLRYDYINDNEQYDYVKVGCIMPKAGLIISRNEMSPIHEPHSQDIIEAVVLECAGTGQFNVKCEKAEEANKIYQEIKRWLI